ncbi:unnamed protein product, partial [Rotaria sordida]
MNNEYFLNQWFSQSLERSRQTVLNIYAHNINQSEQKSMLNSDQSLFPINLRSRECWFQPPIVLEISSNDEDLPASPSNIRIADLNVFKRCLTHFEIQAIHQQQTSIKQAK